MLLRLPGFLIRFCDGRLLQCARLHLLFASQNLVFRLRRIEFRAFTHPPAEMLAVLESRGLRHTFSHRGLVLHVAGLER